jgi:hypothetical protein
MKMTTLYPTDIPAFLRQYRFTGSRLKRFKYGIDANGDSILDVVLLTKKAMQSLNTPSERVILRIRFQGVEEFRFQKRPGTGHSPKTDCRFGSFNGLIYVDFDGYTLGQGEVPRLHDFRASDAFAGCRELRYTVVEKVTPVV